MKPQQNKTNATGPPGMTEPRRTNTTPRKEKLK
jgi:hypothetical protein